LCWRSSVSESFLWLAYSNSRKSSTAGLSFSGTTFASHQTAVLTARVQLRHGNPHPLAVDADEDLDDPLVPHLAVVSLAPHADLDLGVVGHVDGSLYRLVQRRD
jgi:hypothetical protein